MSALYTLPAPRVVFHIADFASGSGKPLCGAMVSQFLLGREAAEHVAATNLCRECVAARESSAASRLAPMRQRGTGCA